MVLMNETINPENVGESRKTHFGAITLFYMNSPEGRKYLVAQNSATQNITFISGAAEEVDAGSLTATAQREVEEELGLAPDTYTLKEIDVRHEFTFGPKKVDRAGDKGSYQVFVAELTDHADEFVHTSELTGVRWLTESEVLEHLTFPDLREVFQNTLQKIV